ncbi:hypothetical protein YC2023_009755 [Brassica napus]
MKRLGVRVFIDEMLPTVPRKFQRNTDGNGSFLGISSELVSAAKSHFLAVATVLSSDRWDSDFFVYVLLCRPCLLRLREWWSNASGLVSPNPI